MRASWILDSTPMDGGRDRVDSVLLVTHHPADRRCPVGA